MGSSFVERSYKQCSVKELNSLVESACGQAAYESGSLYSGDWGEKTDEGIIKPNKTFTSTSAATDWLVDECQKYGPLIAVKVFSVPPCTSTKNLEVKIQSAQSKLHSLKVEVGDHCSGFGEKTKPLLNVIVARVKAEKNKYKTCDCCGSKNSKAHLCVHTCPVCRYADFLLTDTDKKKFARLREKISLVEKELEALNLKRNTIIEDTVNKKSNVKNWHWQVAGWCAS